MEASDVEGSFSKSAPRNSDSPQRFRIYLDPHQLLADLVSLVASGALKDDTT